jgi:hypothetical protein
MMVTKKLKDLTIQKKVIDFPSPSLSPLHCRQVLPNALVVLLLPYSPECIVQLSSSLSAKSSCSATVFLGHFDSVELPSETFGKATIPLGAEKQATEQLTNFYGYATASCRQLILSFWSALKPTLSSVFSLFCMG